MEHSRIDSFRVNSKVWEATIAMVTVLMYEPYRGWNVMRHRGETVTGMHGGKERQNHANVAVNIRLSTAFTCAGSMSGEGQVITTGVSGIRRCECDSDLASCSRANDRSVTETALTYLPYLLDLSIR